MTNSNDALRAAQRLTAFCDQWERGSHNGDQIHGIGLGNGEEAHLTVTDIRVTVAALTPSPVAGGDLREAIEAITARMEALEDEASNNLATELTEHAVGFMRGQKVTAKSLRLHLHDMTRAILAALNQPAAPVEAGLLDRAELAWQRFFYPAADCFTGPIGDKLPSVDLEVADCLRLVLAAIGRHVAAPDNCVPALMAKEPSREGQIKTVAEKLAAFTGAPYEDWRHFTVEAGDIIDRLSALAHPPEPAASTVAQGEDDEGKYLILKYGRYYRPNAEGYTNVRSEAGLFTLDEAISHSHPNGPDGPRDGISYKPATHHKGSSDGQ